MNEKRFILTVNGSYAGSIWCDRCEIEKSTDYTPGDNFKFYRKGFIIASIWCLDGVGVSEYEG